MPTISNTFTNGMRVDVDAHLQKNNTYRYAMAGRLAWNRSTDRTKTFEENIKDGASLAFVVAKGNKYELSICSGYKVIGSIDTIKGTVIFSTNGINSEIGWLELNDNVNAPGHAKYFTRYNDRNDPNFKNDIFTRRLPGQPGGDLLNFKESHYITGGFVVYENEFTNRIYWTDNFNQKRTLNLSLLFDETGQPYHPAVNGCMSEVQYPKHLSVHAFDERMDVVFPKQKFQSRIPGQLKSGQYQLVCQYVSKNGHTSVWSDLTRPVFVTDRKMDGDITVGNITYEAAYKSNHHNRTMGASNIMTEEGLRWEVKGIDTRWDQIKIGFVYHTTSVAFQEAVDFKTYDIGSTTSLIVDLTSHTGTSITKAELNQRFETILKVGTTAEQENRTWDADIELLPDLNIDLSGVKIEPQVRFYSNDRTIEPFFLHKFNPVSGRYDNDPITNSFANNATISLSNFTGDSEDYLVVDDYPNYKGQQYNHLLKGYFRGETYPFGLLFLDRKGNPLFVQHIKDFTFPEQFHTKDAAGNPTDWTLTRLDPSNGNVIYDFRILGAKLSNITIPHDILYDKFGKLNVSGFKIVRTERIVTNAAQGIILNVDHSPNESTNNEADGYLHPMASFQNWYGEKPTAVGLPNSPVYNGAMGSAYNREVNPNEPYPEFDAATYFNFHSPDILIEGQIGGKNGLTKEQMMAGQMQKVGFIHKTYSEAVDIFSAHYYSKLLKTSPIEWPYENKLNQNGSAKLGSKSRIKLAFTHDQPAGFLYLKFDPALSEHDYRPNVQAFFSGQYAWKSAQQPNSVVMKLQDWNRVDTMESELNSKTSYVIANWKVTPTKYYSDGNESTSENSGGSLETRRYISTGHYQPITQQVLDKVQKTFKPSGGIENYVFNNVEVWGGDCFNTMFDFTRLYPYYVNCAKSGGLYPDYSNSVLCPIESKYNLDLLFGRRYAANCVMPQRTSCTGENDQLSGGISIAQPEDWSYNEVLLLQENTKFYFPKPEGIKIIEKAESQIRWSPLKVYGELYDSYRQKLVDDYSSVPGKYGKVQKLVNCFNALYAIQESAFSKLRTELRTVIPTEDGTELSVQSGSVFGGADIISNKYGTQHANSIWEADNQLGFVDARLGKIIVFSQNGIQLESENKQMDDPIAQMSVYYDRQIVHQQDQGQFVDIIAAFDYENGEAITTFHYKQPSQQQGTVDDRINEQTSKSLVYNLGSRSFHSWMPFTPTQYIRSGKYLLATNNEVGKANQLCLQNYGAYGQWFGKYYKTILEFVVNNNPDSSKVFDTGWVNVNFDGYDRISRIIHKAENNEQIVIFASNVAGTITRPDDRAVYEESSLVYPMVQADEWDESFERLRGHTLDVTIEIDNSQQAIDGIDKRCAITNFDTIFRASYPGVPYK